MTYPNVYNESNTTGAATTGAGSAYPSGALELSIVFYEGLVLVSVLMFYVVFVFAFSFSFSYCIVCPLNSGF